MYKNRAFTHFCLLNFACLLSERQGCVHHTTQGHRRRWRPQLANKQWHEWCSPTASSSSSPATATAAAATTAVTIQSADEHAATTIGELEASQQRLHHHLTSFRTISPILTLHVYYLFVYVSLFSSLFFRFFSFHFISVLSFVLLTYTTC